ncbi:MAG: hypothetical protein U9P14_09845 [Gemmatimonadota bacterium]|nr:hypothetical protein [Gemmatimonadota bacterium]
MKRENFLLLFLFISLLIVVPVTAQDDEDIPDNYDGNLVKSDLTITMRGGDLEVSITILDKGILRYATREMREYLNMVIDNNLADNMNYDPDSPDCPIPFLVNFRALGREVRYEPYELMVYNFGSEYRPLEIVPISPGFLDRVAYIRQKPVAAIYLFDGDIDLNSQEVTISYANALVFNNWLRIIEAVNKAKTQLEIERSRSSDR